MPRLSPLMGFLRVCTKLGTLIKNVEKETNPKMLLILDTVTSVCIFSILFSIHFLMC